jgi:hypothetical protein
MFSMGRTEVASYRVELWCYEHTCTTGEEIASDNSQCRQEALICISHDDISFDECQMWCITYFAFARIEITFDGMETRSDDAGCGSGMEIAFDDFQLWCNKII